MAKWHENLEEKDRQILIRLAGRLNLPMLDEYESLNHLLWDIYSRVCEAGSLIRQLSQLME
jgi:hypothetical protein